MIKNITTHLKSTRTYSCRYDVLNSAIKNSGNSSVDFRAKEIKTLLMNYRHLDRKTSQELARMNIRSIPTKNHVKLVYCDDASYTISIPTFCSDVAAGKAIASDIIKMFFLIKDQKLFKNRGCTIDWGSLCFCCVAECRLCLIPYCSKLSTALLF